ncbi:AmmeMemoRadiSam system protein A [Arsenicicoccus sp. oral taxon 190]|uniref:AmmeMemoRadiSam system protein A n=1 Tax=Arsenicicoccus sp. oral taxon 190 TaxID=1658671 RepID=UPI00067A33B8|nr:AmmeMemoRadiSam system protein A [Arsenicicoccus sp. oral taxon 190]AKT51861.1 hypothetical protein ADJ73_12315 [Arsenicicoccus sp. oral taxon 190]
MSRLPADAETVLLPLARSAIERAVGLDAPVATDLPRWCREDGASFVTLHLDGRLRGCIGSLSAYRPLAADVSRNARAAALDDPRFAPVTAQEAPDLHLEVSVLSSPEPLPAGSEAEVAALLRPGVDGVVLEGRGRRGTYLPQVWAQIPEPAAFLRHLKAKAGLPADWWGEDVRVCTYTVRSFEEGQP